MAIMPTTNGSVQTGYRPVIIIQNNMGNTYAPTVSVVPLTSHIKKELPTHTEIDGCGLTKKSIALVEQIQTLSKDSLKRCIGQVDDATMSRINDCIRIQLGI